MAFPRVALNFRSRFYGNDRFLFNRHNANSRLRSLLRVWWRRFASYNDRLLVVRSRRVQVNHDGIVKTERRFWRKVRYIRFCYFNLYFFILSFYIFCFVSGTYTTIAIWGNRREKIGRKPHAVSWVKYSSKSDRTENVLKYFGSWFRPLWSYRQIQILSSFCIFCSYPAFPTPIALTYFFTQYCRLNIGLPRSLFPTGRSSIARQTKDLYLGQT